MSDQREAGPTPEHPLPPPVVISTPEQLDGLRRALRGVPRLAVDTESNSLYAYQERVCLIQLSTDQTDFLIDPLPFHNGALSFLGDLFADPAVEKVFHAAEYDVMSLRRDYRFSFACIFDTMTSTRVLGHDNSGLAALLGEHFGVSMNKTHQRANWGRRPLSDDLIRYAQLDVHYLLRLRDRLYAALAERGRLEEAQELFEEVCQAEWRGSRFDPHGFWDLPGARGLLPHKMAVLRELYLFREQRARSANLPVFKVLTDAALVQLAGECPRSVHDIHRLPGLGQAQMRRYGPGIIDCVARGLDAAPPRRRHARPPSDDLAVRRYDALHTWRKDRAARRGVPSDVVLSRDALWELAAAAPRTLAELEHIRALGPWRRQAYGSEILEVLSRVEGR